MVTVTALSAPTGGVSRLSFMTGQIETPDDFDRMGGAVIENLFGGEG